MSYRKQILGVVVILALGACGGGGNKAADAAASAVASAAAAAPSAVASAAGNAMSNAGGAMASAGNAMQSAGNAMAAGTAAIPADLNCGAVKPVWVNTKTHVYHEANDPMYGKTKAGKYLCPSAAKAEGDRPAGGSTMMHHHKGKS